MPAPAEPAHPAWWRAARDDLAARAPDLRVAVYASGGAPFHHAALVAQWGAAPVPLGAGAIRGGALDAFDALIVPGGGLQAMGGLLAPLGAEGTARVRAWVEAGGTYVGSCAGAYLPATLPESFVARFPEVAPLHLLDLPLANGADAGLGGLDSPGVGVVEARVTDPGHPLARGLPERFEVVHYNGPCFRPPADGAVRPVARLAGRTAAFTPWERSLPGASHEGGLLVDALAAEGAANVVAGPAGRGEVVLFGSHPEFGFDAVQLGWGVAARLLANALVGAAERRPSPRPAPPLPATAPNPALRDALAHVADEYERAADRLRAFLARPPAALDAAPAFLGRAAPALWRDALREAADLAARTAAFLRALRAAGVDASRAAPWVAHAPPDGQDYGFVGLGPLAARLHGLLDAAERLPSSPSPPPAGPYDAWDRSAYHLLASSYLSAAGLAASAALAVGTLGRLAGFDAPPPHALFRPEPAPQAQAKEPT